MDHQKGLERLVALFERTRSAPDSFEWRIVGKSVLGDAHRVDLTSIADVLEPPIYDTAGLDKLYAWADLFILPSRFEGVPLTLLEAARFGCVPCATGVGAVPEIVEDGVDGVLVAPNRSDDEIAHEFFEKLMALSRDRPRLLSMARLSAERAGRSSWKANMGEFFESLQPEAGV